ncbi:MAG TPA: ComF family protein [Chloroflexia bacterium]
MLATSTQSKAWSLILDLLYPPRCGGCDRRGDWFCSSCRESIAPPHEQGHSIMGVHGLVCAGDFDGSLRQAIHNLKYENDTPLAHPLAEIMHAALEHSPHWPDLQRLTPTILPVPLHKEKQRSRGYNQAHLLGRELARLTGWHMAANLKRMKHTRSQVGLDAHERAVNVRDAFAWEGDETYPAVLLVDDVFTTGSTLSECVAVVRATGVKRIYIAAVARAKA